MDWFGGSGPNRPHLDSQFKPKEIVDIGIISKNVFKYEIFILLRSDSQPTIVFYIIRVWNELKIRRSF